MSPEQADADPAIDHRADRSMRSARARVRAAHMASRLFRGRAGCEAGGGPRHSKTLLAAQVTRGAGADRQATRLVAAGAGGARDAVPPRRAKRRPIRVQTTAAEIMHGLDEITNAGGGNGPPTSVLGPPHVQPGRRTNIRSRRAQTLVVGAVVVLRRARMVRAQIAIVRRRWPTASVNTDSRCSPSRPAAN
jgi:hypothetical protein